jgi:hypothetical protein
MKRLIALTLVAALMTPALPAFAADSESPVPNRPAASLRESAKVAVTMQDSTPAKAYGQRSMPRQPNDGARYQGGGGGHVGMIIGLVTTAAGIAGTVYMLKAMKKSNDNANKTN